jgi:hypothetical protein
MTTYNGAAVSDTAIAFKNGITLQQGRALRDNAKSMIEGNGGPVNSPGWHPFDMVEVGDGATGEVWSFAADGAVASIVFDFSDNKYDYMFRWAGLSASATSTLTLQGVAFSGSLSIANETSGYAEILNPNVLNMPKTAFINFRLIAGAAGPTGNTTAITPYVGWFNFTNFATAMTSLTFAPSAGNFDAGAVYLYRRRSFIVA